MWKLDHKEGWVLKNCFFWIVLEKTPESPLGSKEIKPVNPKGNQPWLFIGRTDAEVPILWPPDVEEPTHWKRLGCWEGLKAKGEGGSRGWDGWIALPTHWMWANSRRWWRTGKPGMLQSTELQRVGHNIATRQQQKELVKQKQLKIMVRLPTLMSTRSV